jgi:predicted CxxxxCH...CXXCH cytochrome family protein
VNVVAHVNGTNDPVSLTCTSCHGEETRVGVTGADSNVKVAPPVTATGRPAGAHLAHVNLRAKTDPAQCQDCHSGKIPTSLGHADATIDVVFGGRATLGGAAPSYDASAGCSATYCHGNYSGVYTYSNWPEGQEEPTIYNVPYVGARATPRWTDGAATCGSCHGNPPPGYWHAASTPTRPDGGHGVSTQYQRCELCHPDAAGDNATGGATITNPALHVNGTVEVSPRWSSACNGCH